jgi:hypothetical protein
MAKPRFEWTNWDSTDELTWAKESPTFNNLIPAGAVLDVDEFPSTPGEPVTIPSGTLVMRALADRDDGPWVPFDHTSYNSSTHEAFLTYHAIYDARNEDEVTLYRHGRIVAYNKLPGWDDLHADAKAAVHALYQTVYGAE